MSGTSIFNPHFTDTTTDSKRWSDLLRVASEWGIKPVTGLQASSPSESPEFQVIDEMIGFKGQAGSFHVDILLLLFFIKLYGRYYQCHRKLKKKQQQFKMIKSSLFTL